jgi:ubiquinone/menaquinone biosynthesis C-methylase UbiE
LRSEIRILDLGCGSGSNLLVYEREGFEAHGIDGSLNGLLTAKKVVASFLNTGFKTHLTNANLISLPYKESTFNTTVDVVSLQHPNSDEGQLALLEIHRVLKSGGKLFSFRLSQGSGIYTKLRESASWLDEITVANIPDGLPLADNGPTAFWSVDHAEQELTAIGFVNISITKLSRTYKDSQMVEYLEINAMKA